MTTGKSPAKPRTVKVIVEVAPPGPVEVAITAMPTVVKQTVKKIMDDPDLRVGIDMMTERVSEFRNTTAAIMAGIFVVPQARAVWDEALDLMWSKTAAPRNGVGEVIIGAGLQAATYATARVAMGFPPPFIIEKEPRVGGAFAVSRKPSFLLNSRNRPGPIGIPGVPGTALNVLPMGFVQVSDVSADEYVDNATMAWVIRANLALAGCKVLLNEDVSYYDCNTFTKREYAKPVRLIARLTLRGRRLQTFRLLWATGLSREKAAYAKPNDRYLSFMQFMAGMDKPFPLRGMKRVAVIGSGDSGRTAIEALTGKGPSPNMSVPALDYVEKIDWYGVPAAMVTKQGWCENSRTRYRSIGSLLPDDVVSLDKRFELARVKAFAVKLDGSAILPGWRGFEINLREYDYVIDCTGMQATAPDLGNEYRSDGPDGRRLGKWDGQTTFALGVSAALPMDKRETEEYGKIKENSVAMFRYASRTAQLARMLPAF